jgi:two-component system cell cycle sensor histidine kinase/response regulator CckA
MADGVAKSGAPNNDDFLVREGGKQLDLLIDNMTIAVSITDINGCVVKWNAASEALFGWTASEVLGRPFHEFHVPPEDREQVLKFVDDLLAGAPQRHTVHTNLGKGGKRLRIEWFSHILRGKDGEPVGVLALAQDVTERERDAELLRLMSSAVSYSTNAIMITREKQPNEDTPHIVYVNRAFEKLTGYSLAEAVGQSPRILHGPKTDRAVLSSLVPYFIDHKDFTVQLLHYKKDGSEFDAELTVFPTADETGTFTHWVSIQMDITELKRANEKLAESENRYRRLVEEAGDSIYLADTSGRLTYANPLVQKMTGFSEDELKGRHFTKVAVPEWRERIFKFYLDQYREGRLESSYEFPIRTKDGEERWVEQTVRLLFEGDKAVGFNCIMRDIHERKKVDAELTKYREQLEELVDQRAMELRVALRRLKTLVKNIPGVVFRCEATKPGVMAFLSDGIKELSGMAWEELTGATATHYIDLVLPEDRGPYRDVILEHVVRDFPYEVEYRIRTTSNDVKWVQEFGRVVLSENGARMIEGVILDIDSRKRAEAEREKAEDDLRQAQKIEAVGQLAGGIAHDFNNLLQVITTYTQFAIRAAGPEHKAQRDLAQILKAARSATDLTRQLLAFGRRQILQPVNVHLDEVVREVMGMLGRVIGENFVLELIPGYDICTVRADPGQIEQVLVNLCVNSRDAMPKGGRITIKIKNVVLDAEFIEEHAAAMPGEFVRLSVTDNGAGMPKEVLDRIFEPFYTTKEVGKGTGMGLATVFGIVKQHSGFILVESEVGTGTSFHIYLPVVDGTIKKADLRPVPAGEALGGSETLLLAEDEEAVRESVLRVLKEAGYRVLVAKDGEEAVELFREHSSEISLLVSDMVMPRMSGRDAYEAMLRMSPQLCVLFTSGYSLGGDASDFVLLDGMHMIQKPYDADTLLRKIREVIDG